MRPSPRTMPGAVALAVVIGIDRLTKGRPRRGIVDRRFTRGLPDLIRHLRRFPVALFAVPQDGPRTLANVGGEIVDRNHDALPTAAVSRSHPSPFVQWGGTGSRQRRNLDRRECLVLVRAQRQCALCAYNRRHTCDPSSRVKRVPVVPPTGRARGV